MALWKGVSNISRGCAKLIKSPKLFFGTMCFYAQCYTRGKGIYITGATILYIVTTLHVGRAPYSFARLTSSFPPKLLDWYQEWASHEMPISHYAWARIYPYRRIIPNQKLPFIRFTRVGISPIITNYTYKFPHTCISYQKMTSLYNQR